MTSDYWYYPRADRSAMQASNNSSVNESGSVFRAACHPPSFILTLIYAVYAEEVDAKAGNLSASDIYRPVRVWSGAF